jgi:PAS domain S-box-containing protein
MRENIIFTLDGHGTILTLNPAFERITSWPAEEWIGQDFLDLVPRERRRAANRRFALVLYHGGSPLERVVVRARDGRDVILEVAVVKNVVDGQPELLGVSASPSPSAVRATAPPSIPRRDTHPMQAAVAV